MINKIISFLKGKKILILGFGKEGKSSLSFIRKYLPDCIITIADKNEVDLDNKSDVFIISGEKYLDYLNDFDIVLKSPGISLKDLDTSRAKIFSQLDLFLRFSNITTIGITGTKGKTTTSTLIYNALKHAKKKCFLLGNIGVPVFECLPNITENSIAVIEISSHQLEFMTHSPNISLITNFYQEHLDHYLSYEHYINAKLNIFRFQKNSDYCIFNIDQDEYLDRIKYSCKSNIIKISLNNNTKDDCVFLDDHFNIVHKTKYFCIKDLNKNLIGYHHFYDILFTFAVCNILNIDSSVIKSSLEKFDGIPHRMEYVGKFNGILFYNDSIATIPASVINAVNSLKFVDTIIIGGMDRGIDYTEFSRFLDNSNISNIICLYETGQKIANIMASINPESSSKTYMAKNLKDAVDFAFCHTKKNNICLLSPASASYGYFKNFEERGNEYKKLVISHDNI